MCAACLRLEEGLDGQPLSKKISITSGMLCIASVIKPKVKSATSLFSTVSDARYSHSCSLLRCRFSCLLCSDSFSEEHNHSTHFHSVLISCLG